MEFFSIMKNKVEQLKVEKREKYVYNMGGEKKTLFLAFLYSVNNY